MATYSDSLLALRVCETLCTFTGLDISIAWAATLRATIFEFFQIHYIAMLEKISAHVIYRHDGAHKPGPVPHPPHAREAVLKETTMDGYDFIQVISVEGVLQHFGNLWQSYRDKTEDYARCLIKWSHGQDMTASFGAITMKFLSQGKAMIWIHLEEGSLLPLEGCVTAMLKTAAINIWSSDKRCHFFDWSIAFEVDVTIAEHEMVAKKSKSWSNRFKESLAWKSHGNQTSHTLRHLGLDLSCKHRYVCYLTFEVDTNVI